MFGWFERRLDPYPSAEPEQPPQGLVAFCLHYSKGVKRWLIIMACLSATISASEVFIYGFFGKVVDWLGGGEPSTFFAREGRTLAIMAVFLVVLFGLVTLNSFIIHQTLLGNFPQRIRWMSHRYLLRQSMSYFQDEFAGRIAAKLMQTSLAVREVMMKLLDVVVFVSVYFVGAVILAATSDWRLAIPFVVWLAVYSLLLRHYIPRLGKVSERQADARSMMTGRVVDSYTNIATVKLFSHSSREEDYARQSMDEFLGTVHGQMRMFSLLNFGIYGLNSALLMSVTGLGIWLWTQGQVSAGSLAVAVALVLRFGGMAQWVMWEMTQLFENIGTVRDGISSISLPSIVKDQPGAPALTGVKGDIRFDHVTFNYGKKDGGIIDGLDL
ncbi:MAG: ABC transporter ATP-binding protein, partial [Devosia sp.]|nr:ABC transporter ATP-binding protein [Devosia sp.]